MDIQDGLENLVANIGTDRDKAKATAWVVWDRSPVELESIYRSGWMGRKIVDIPTDDMTREWRSWSAEDELVKQIEAAEKAFAIRDKVTTAKRWARLFGSAAIIIGAHQRLGRPEDPLDIARMSTKDLLYLHVEIAPYLTIAEWDNNIASPNFGKAAFYTYQPFRHGAPVDTAATGVSGGVVRLHASRVIPFAGAPLPPYAALQGAKWGDSVYTAIEQSLNTAGGVTAVIASLIYEQKIDVIKTDLSGLATKEGEDRIRKRFGLAMALKSVNNTLLLGRDEEFDQKQFTWAGLSDIHIRIMQEISGAADIPITRFLGQSPSGLQSTGESDLRNYYDGIRARQQAELSPQLETLDRALFASNGITLPKDANFAWKPLWQETPKERADNALKRAQATKIYVDSGLIDDSIMTDAVASQLVEDRVYPNLEAAIKDARARGETIEGDDDEADDGAGAAVESPADE